MERGESCRRILSRGRLFQLGRSAHADPRPCAYHAIQLVYVASTSMIPYALDLAPAVPVVVDFGDLDSEWWQERSRRFSGLKARVYEAEADGSVPSSSWPRARRPTVSCPPRRRPS